MLRPDAWPCSEAVVPLDDLAGPRADSAELLPEGALRIFLRHIACSTDAFLKHGLNLSVNVSAPVPARPAPVALKAFRNNLVVSCTPYHKQLFANAHWVQAGSAI